MCKKRQGVANKIWHRIKNLVSSLDFYVVLYCIYQILWEINNFADVVNDCMDNDSTIFVDAFHSCCCLFFILIILFLQIITHRKDAGFFHQLFVLTVIGLFSVVSLALIARLVIEGVLTVSQSKIVFTEDWALFNSFPFFLHLPAKWYFLCMVGIKILAASLPIIKSSFKVYNKHTDADKQV